jgi:transcriptional regulator with XRE-family HTH domain
MLVPEGTDKLMSLGKTISQIRKQKNLKQAELAAKLGVNQSVVARWENNQIRPRRSSLSLIAQALDTPLEALLVEDATGTLSGIQTLNPDLSELLQSLPKLADDQLAALKIVVRDMLTRSSLQTLLQK